MIIAHRGDSSHAHENTLEAFQAAMDARADMIELDVRRTGDGQLIVAHDEDVGGLLLRNADIESVQRRSVELGFRIPSFREVLSMTSGQISLDIELKEPGYEEVVVGALLDHCFRVDRVVVTSFEPQSIIRIKKRYPDIKTGLLVENMSGEDAIRAFLQVSPDYLAPDHAMLSPSVLSEASNLGINVITWTVNDPSRMLSLLKAKPIIGIVTDNLSMALRTTNSFAEDE